MENRCDLTNVATQLSDEMLSVGHKTWAMLSENEADIDRTVLSQFYNGVRKFYISVSSTIIKKFTFGGHLLSDLLLSREKS